MTPPPEKLAGSLDLLRSLQERGVVAVRAADLPRSHRERLVRHGFLRSVIRGWYVAAAPDRRAGDSTAWYASFWPFCAGYLNARFGAGWCLSPEQSLALHAGDRTVPGQLLVRAPRGRNRVTPLLHGTSLLEVRAAMPAAGDVVDVEGVRAFSPTAALVACPARFFRRHPVEARAALTLVRDASDLLPRLLDGGRGTVAGRLAAALRDIGRDRVADEIVAAMRAADFGLRESNPFATPPPARPVRAGASPLVQRLRLTWDAMRGRVADHFPRPPGAPADVDVVLARIEDVYVTDAYHSLSIEGYRVSPTLVARVRAGGWNPDRHPRRPGAPRRARRPRVLAGVPGGARQRPPGGRRRASGRRGGGGPPHLVPRAVRAGRRRRPRPPRRPRRLPRRARLHPAVDARAAESARGPRRDAGAVRAAARRARPGRARGAGPLPVRVRPPPTRTATAVSAGS